MAKVSTRQITPAMAKRYLRESADNFRPISQKAVACYARDMKAGNWDIGESVIFNGAGKLIDGQHRMQAVIQSGATVEFVCVHGAVGKPIGLDQGRIRRAGWVLHHVEGVKNASQTASLIRAVLGYEVIGSLALHYPQYSPTHHETLAYYRKHQGRIEEIVKASRHPNLQSLRASGAAAKCAWIGGGIYGGSRELGAEFLEAMASDKPQGDTLMSLHRRLVRENGKRVADRLGNRDMLRLVMVAWNHWVVGTGVKKLLWKSNNVDFVSK